MTTQDEPISWRNNYGDPVPPPSEAAEWVAVIRSTVSQRVTVKLNYDGKGRWWVTAHEQPAD